MEKKTRKVRKGKKMLGIILISIVVLIIVIVAIVMIVRKVNEGSEPTDQEQQQTAIPLPDTTYSDMQVSNIYMEYLDEQDQTMVSMSILNTTQNAVENESLDAILVGADGEVLGQMQTWIQSLGVGEQYDISVILNGNLTATQSIQLQKVTNE